MQVVIKFKIDKELLSIAIRSLIYFNQKITKKSVINTIKFQVHSGGITCVNFTEVWGSDILEADLDEGLVFGYIEKYKSLIGI